MADISQQHGCIQPNSFVYLHFSEYMLDYTKNLLDKYNYMELSKSQEDYLKIIWHIERCQEKVTATVVADKHKVKSPTVLSMFRQLSEMDLITYNKLNGAQLTENGEQLARKLIRKHRLIETFLEQVLKVDDPLLHDEAEKLEHVISDKLMYRIDAFLGFPENDPHGSPIPAWDKQREIVTINNLEEGVSFEILEIIIDEDHKQFYDQRFFIKGTTWTLTEKAPDDSAYLVTNGQNFLALSDTIIDKIKVIPFSTVEL